MLAINICPPSPRPTSPTTSRDSSPFNHTASARSSTPRPATPRPPALAADDSNPRDDKPSSRDVTASSSSRTTYTTHDSTRDTPASPPPPSLIRPEPIKPSLKLTPPDAKPRADLAKIPEQCLGKHTLYVPLRTEEIGWEEGGIYWAGRYSYPVVGVYAGPDDKLIGRYRGGPKGYAFSEIWEPDLLLQDEEPEETEEQKLEKARLAAEEVKKVAKAARAKRLAKEAAAKAKKELEAAKDEETRQKLTAAQAQAAASSADQESRLAREAEEKRQLAAIEEVKRIAAESRRKRKERELKEAEKAEQAEKAKKARLAVLAGQRASSLPVTANDNTPFIATGGANSLKPLTALPVPAKPVAMLVDEPERSRDRSPSASTANLSDASSISSLRSTQSPERETIATACTTPEVLPVSMVEDGEGSLSTAKPSAPLSESPAGDALPLSSPNMEDGTGDRVGDLLNAASEDLSAHQKECSDAFAAEMRKHAARSPAATNASWRQALLPDTGLSSRRDVYGVDEARLGMATAPQPALERSQSSEAMMTPQSGAVSPVHHKMLPTIFSSMDLASPSESGSATPIFANEARAAHRYSGLLDGPLRMDADEPASKMDKNVMARLPRPRMLMRAYSEQLASKLSAQLRAAQVDEAL